MEDYESNKGDGRAKVLLSARYLGKDLVVCIYNGNAHIGAVAIGEFDNTENRASASVITRLGHKDDVVAQQAAHSIAKATKRPVCVIAGMHLEDITGVEIRKIVENAAALVDGFIKSVKA